MLEENTQLHNDGEENNENVNGADNIQNTAEDIRIDEPVIISDEEWLSFVVNNRKGNIIDSKTDMHIGPVADDNVYQSI